MVSNAQVVVLALVLGDGGHDGGGVIGKADNIQEFYGAIFPPCKVQQRKQNKLWRALELPLAQPRNNVANRL